jgi:hypothetical protein
MRHGISEGDIAMASAFLRMAFEKMSACLNGA